ncbi:MAG: sigma-70 family RNA polymerase sigma factor [Planctomycetota bacterium]|nr:sigma-70 family RNA polymerase sigma factor [Planctomycetota bacterium]
MCYSLARVAGSSLVRSLPGSPSTADRVGVCPSAPSSRSQAPVAGPAGKDRGAGSTTSADATKTDESSQESLSEESSSQERSGQAGPLNWSRILSDHGPMVRAICRSRGLASDESDDVMQNVLIALFRSKCELKNPYALRAWIRTAARREAGRIARTAKRAFGLDEALQMASPENFGSLDDRRRLRARIREAMQELSPNAGRLLHALFFSESGSAYQHVATALGVPIGSIGPVRQRALRAMEQALESATDCEPLTA